MSTSTITTLPPEILLDIFQYVCTPATSSHPPHPSFPDSLHAKSPPHVLRQTTRLWRTLIESTPSLWTQITLSSSLRDITKSKVLTKLRYHRKYWSLDPAEDDAAIARLKPLAQELMQRAFDRLDGQLSLSGELPLQVYIHPPGDAVDCVADVLARFTVFLMDRSAARWELFSFKETVAKRYIEVFRLRSRFSSSRYDFTQLKHLRYSIPEYHSSYPGTIELHADFPVLRTALLTGPCTSRGFIPWSQLEDLAVQSHVLDRLESVIPNLTSVRSLLLHELGRSRASPPPIDPPHNILPHLEVLAICCRWWSEWPTCMHNVVAPRLRKIVLKDMDMSRPEGTSAVAGIEALTARSRCTISHALCINLSGGNGTEEHRLARFREFLYRLPHLQILEIRSNGWRAQGGRQGSDSDSDGALSLMNDDGLAPTSPVSHKSSGRGAALDIVIQTLASSGDTQLPFVLGRDLRELSLQWDNESLSSFADLVKMLQERIQFSPLEKLRIEFKGTVPENLLPLPRFAESGRNRVDGSEWVWTRFNGSA